MSFYSTIRRNHLIKLVRSLIPNKTVNQLKHLPSAILANYYYGFPAKDIKTIGITGSDGKTSTVTTIYHILTQSNIKAAYISTVEAKNENKTIETGFHVTSPDPWALQKIISTFKQQTVNYLILEATSHGLDQHRLWGIPFEIGVITNITHEHLDYHGTYQNYLLAKAQLLKNVKTAILNKDDKSYSQLVGYLNKNNPKAKIITYGIKKTEADFTARNIKLNKEGVNFTYAYKKQVTDIISPVYGKFNIYNLLASIAVAHAVGLKIKAIQNALQTVPQIPGRMNIFHHKKRKIIVDFAHTPNGMESLLTALKHHFQTKNNQRIITVFGCAGQRDVKKRPIMGEIARKNSQICIITAEDPRTESVESINKQIIEGMDKQGYKLVTPRGIKRAKNDHKCLIVQETDREKAIKLAYEISKPGDVLAILGKGHERTLAYDDKEIPWSDLDAVNKLMK